LPDETLASMTWSVLASAAAAWLFACAAVLAIAFRRELADAWREPVLAAPVLIVESDDWGYGPLEQARRLGELAVMLGRHRDCDGHPAVMTLGVVLAGPDVKKIAAGGCAEYHRLRFADAPFGAVREAMHAGAQAGVFALQLHGMEHYWPAVLMGAARADARIRDWLGGRDPARTEDLPPHLQSRWIDASALPSRELPEADIERAVEEEVAEFRTAFGHLPEVVVPPTFIWSDVVERAWARAGLRCLVTPGCRYHGRDAAARPLSDHRPLRNGGRAAAAMVVVVRDDYFEPSLGHCADRALAALEEKTRCGRPCLIETHRSNFIAQPAAAERALAELDRALAAARGRFPGLRFRSTAELARHYAESDWPVERGLAARLHCVVVRLARTSRLRKIAWASGLALPAAILWLVTVRARKAARAK